MTTLRAQSKRIVIGMIRGYQVVRANKQSPCRFWPSCSQYAVEAVDLHGPVRGLWLALRRLLRCRPFGPSGVDPVPEPKHAHPHTDRRAAAMGGA